jgi:YihY family inner membrane protein
MAKVASKPKKRPGLTRRMARSTLRAGMPATAVMVGRKTAGGARSSDGRGTRAGGSDGSQGLGAAAGGGPSAGHQTDPRAIANNDRGRGLDGHRQADRKKVKADQVPLLATVIGILTALWSASSGMKALITGVNLAYDETEGRKFVKLRGLSILMTLAAMVLLAVALALIVGFPAVPDSWPTVLQWAAAFLRFVLLAVLLMAGLAVLYRYAPDRDEPKWTWVSWGSAVATVLWVLASIGFSIYVKSFGNYNKTYGALAGIIILMFWLWLTALIVLVGAELNTEMELQTARDTTKGPEQPMGERGGHAADHVAEAPAAGS